MPDLRRCRNDEEETVLICFIHFINLLLIDYFDVYSLLLFDLLFKLCTHEQIKSYVELFTSSG